VAIYAYTGRPGSGKSYGVVYNIILPACKKGIPIYTNIPLHLDKIFCDYPDAEIVQLKTEDFLSTKLEKEVFDPASNKNIKISDPIKNKDTGEIIAETVGEKTWLDIPNGALIVVDEIGSIYPVGSTIRQYSREFIECWTMHRHKLDENGRPQDIVILCQDLSQIAMFIRKIVDTTYIAIKMDALGASGRFRTDTYDGAMLIDKATPKKRIKYQLEKYKKTVFQYYESHTKKSADGIGLQGAIVDSKKNILKTPFFLVGMPFFLFFTIGAFYWLFTGFFKTDLPPDPKPKQTTHENRIEKVVEMKKQGFSFYNDMNPNAENQNNDNYDDRIDNKVQGVISSGSSKYAIIQRNKDFYKIIKFDLYCKESNDMKITCKHGGVTYISFDENIQ
jgi:zona occludens toxin (predicted ATPase)